MTSNYPPATEPVTDFGRTLPPAALNIAGAALDAGIFYQREFAAACVGPWAEAFPARDRSITPGEGGCGYLEVPQDIPGERALREQVCQQLAGQPRGTWALLRRPWGDDPSRATWTAVMSAGDGDVATPDLSGMPGQPTFERVLERMVDSEIYTARVHEQKRRDGIDSQVLIQAMGWRVGSVLRAVRIGGREYSSARITGFTPQGHLALELTRRGSGKRWSWCGYAQQVVRQGARQGAAA